MLDDKFRITCLIKIKISIQKITYEGVFYLTKYFIKIIKQATEY